MVAAAEPPGLAPPSGNGGAAARVSGGVPWGSGTSPITCPERGLRADDCMRPGMGSRRTHEGRSGSPIAGNEPGANGIADETGDIVDVQPRHELPAVGLDRL